MHECLPDAQSKLLVETAVESGLRWGEVTELRVSGDTHLGPVGGPELAGPY